MPSSRSTKGRACILHGQQHRAKHGEWWCRRAREPGFQGASASLSVTNPKFCPWLEAPCLLHVSLQLDTLLVMLIHRLEQHIHRQRFVNKHSIMPVNIVNSIKECFVPQVVKRTYATLQYDALKATPPSFPHARGQTPQPQQPSRLPAVGSTASTQSLSILLTGFPAKAF